MIKWNNVCIKYRTHVVFPSLSLDLSNGRSLGIVGTNNTGKTTLAKAIAGQMEVWGGVEVAADKAKIGYVPFHSVPKLLNGQSAYRQQRWNNIVTEFVPTVRYYLAEFADPVLLEKFDMAKHIDSFLINLSNGEMKKLELVKTLAKHPNMVVLDNAFTGLDVHARKLLSEMINQLAHEGVQVVLTGLSVDEFPSSIKLFLPVFSSGAIHVTETFHGKATLFDGMEMQVPSWQNSNLQEIIHLQKVSLAYGAKQILQNIDWTVNSGERWVLLGNNGSGKTSLLNLIFADNPKAYGCDIRLFGRQKGSGETIWDIKRRIGFVSPEMHQYLPPRQKVSDVVCSGFFDTEGSFRKASGFHLRMVEKWLTLVGLKRAANKAFEELSTSEQRLVLFIRTLVKNPPLLILDEPFQGLDSEHVDFLKSILNEIAATSDCTMIFVTHHPSEIPSCFKHLLKLKDGGVEYCGKRLV